MYANKIPGSMLSKQIGEFKTVFRIGTQFFSEFCPTFRSLFMFVFNLLKEKKLY